MIKCNTEKPLKLPPIGAVIAFIIISNILFFGFLVIIINNIWYYTNIYYNTQERINCLPQITNIEQLEAAQSNVVSREYYINRVPVQGRFVKDPLNHLADDTYIYVSYDQERANRFACFTKWEMNKWNVPTEGRTKIKALNSIELSINHDNHVPITPLEISSENFAVLNENDRIIANLYYTKGDWNDLRLTAYALRNNDKVSFIARIGNDVQEIVPLYKAEHDVLYFFNGIDDKNDFKNISWQQVKAIFKANNDNGLGKFFICVFVLICSGGLAILSYKMSYKLYRNRKKY